MIAYVRQDGTILGGVYAAHPSDINGITHIPDGCQAVYIDDTQYPNVWTNMGEWTIVDGVPTHTPIPDSVKLANAQQSAIEQLATLRDNAIFSTFTSSCTGTQYTYTADDRARTRYNFLATKSYNDTTYKGDSVYTHEAGFVMHTPQQLIQLANDGAQHEIDMWKQYETLATQVRSATTPQDALAVVSQWKV